MPWELFGFSTIKEIRERKRLAAIEARKPIRHMKAVAKRRKRKRGGPK